MPNDREACGRRRLELARIAEAEGRLALQGNERFAGDSIEKYLVVFRDAFNRNGGYTKYSDPSVGYPWCCAFVYHCCLKAGFTFPPKPMPKHRWTLGAVPAWYDWAVMPENDFYFPADDAYRSPDAGDLILFDRLLEDKELDHIGIVLSVSPTGIRTAEGNVHNRSGIFERPATANVHGYIRLTRF